MSAATDVDLSFVLDATRVMSIAAGAPAGQTWIEAAAPIADSRPVSGTVLAVRDSSGTEGWWGPLQGRTARTAAALAERLRGHCFDTPGALSSAIQRGDRHAHTGAGAVAAAALELACWDLLGQRAELPVWRLLVPEPRVQRVAVYATCFGGPALGSDASLPLVAELADRDLIQKWRPPVPTEAVDAFERAHAGSARAAIALDFGGTLPAEDSSAYLRGLPHAPVWAEDAAPAGELGTLAEHDFPCELAAGETCYTSDEFRVIRAAGVTIWQPDGVFCGGLTAYLRVAAMANAAGSKLAPHGGGLLVAVHAAAVAEPEPLVEHHLLLEPRRQTHLAEPLMPGPSGAITIPELPGWHGTLSSAVVS